MAQSGQTAVTTAGTAVKLATNQACEVVEVRAKSGNTGNVFIGNDGAGDVTVNNGFELVKGGDSVRIRTKNLNQWWIDAGTNGDGVSWIIVE